MENKQKIDLLFGFLIISVLVNCFLLFTMQTSDYYVQIQDSYTEPMIKTVTPNGEAYMPYGEYLYYVSLVFDYEDCETESECSELKEKAYGIRGKYSEFFKYLDSVGAKGLESTN